MCDVNFAIKEMADFIVFKESGKKIVGIRRRGKEFKINKIKNNKKDFVLVLKITLCALFHVDSLSCNYKSLFIDVKTNYEENFIVCLI